MKMNCLGNLDEINGLLHNKKGGDMARPVRYKNAGELQKAIDVYFRVKEKNGDFCTITDLAVSLGFKSRQTFYNYQEKSEFASTIKRAKDKVFELWY